LQALRDWLGRLSGESRPGTTMRIIPGGGFVTSTRSAGSMAGSLDPRVLLGDRAVAGDPEALAGVFLEVAGAQLPGLPEQQRLRLGVADWLARRDLPEAARRILEPVAADPPEAADLRQRLADLARRVADPALGDATERRLLQERALAVERIAPLLERIAESESQETADALALEASTWTHAPAVLARAARAALASGDQARAAELVDLLAARDPEDPRLPDLRARLAP
jgi:hypothetical protein